MLKQACTPEAGQTFLATVAQAGNCTRKDGDTKGSSVRGTVITAKTKGKIKGEGELALALKSITTAATTAGGAAGGALIGGSARGGKGAAIGALAGAGAGLIGGVATGNKQIEIPAEAPLTFTLSQPLTLPPRPE